MAGNHDIVEYDNLRLFDENSHVNNHGVLTIESSKSSGVKNKLKSDRKCGAYMYVDLFPTLRMKRDILDAKRNLRKVSLSSSAESVVGKGVAEPKLARMNSASYESIVLPEIVSPKTKKRFKHAFSKLVQNFSRSSSKQDVRKEENMKEVPSGYSYPLTFIEPEGKKRNDEKYDRLHTWSPFIAAEFDDNFNQTSSSKESKESNRLNQERRYQLPMTSSQQATNVSCTSRPEENLEKFSYPKRKLSSKENRHLPIPGVSKVLCDADGQELVSANLHTQISHYDHITLHCRRQNLTVT